MFAAPTVVDAKVFARVPDRLRIRGRGSRWASIHRRGRETDCFLEGPCFDSAGRLYVVDVAWGRIFRIDSDGEFEVVAEYDGEPNGLKIDGEGRVIIADHRHGILQLDPITGKVSSLLDGYASERFRGVNDLAFSSGGDLYFTDQGLSGLHDPSGCLYCLRRDRRLERLLTNVPSPNGVVVAPDETAVYVNVTRDNAVWRVPLTSEGRPFKVGAFIRLSGGIGPDGIAMDDNGNFAVAHIGLGTVWVFNAQGEPIARVRSCAGLLTTNVAYGGADRRSLFITESESGQVLVARPGVATCASLSDD